MRACVGMGEIAFGDVFYIAGVVVRGATGSAGARWRVLRRGHDTAPFLV